MADSDISDDISSAFQLADPADKERFFARLRKLNVNNPSELDSFLDDYKYRKLIVAGFNRDLVMVGRNESTVFEDFTLQVWKKYYIEEDVVQIGILQGSLSFPVEVSSSLHQKQIIFRLVEKKSISILDRLTN